MRLEPSGWGTKVVLTATPVDGAPMVEPAVAEPQPVAAEPEPVAVAEPEPVEVAEPEPARAAEVRDGVFARLFRRFRREAPEPAPPDDVAEAEPAPEAAAEPPEVEPAAARPEPEAKPDVTTATDPEAALAAALDSLGQAHHRPFSRA